MNIEKFSGKASIYEKFRPEYPKEFIEYLYSNVGFNQSSIIADIGSGTGILTGQLLEKGSRVYGVEPNRDMRSRAEFRLSGFDRFTSVDGTAENTKLEDRSADFITVAQAFHWFDISAFKKECQRILRPNGLAVLVWNSRLSDSAIVIDNAEVFRKYCPEFKGFSGGIEERTSDFSVFFKEGSYTTKQFNNDISYDLEGFIGRSLSASYSPKKGDVSYDMFIAAVTDIFERYSFNGKVIIPNITRAYIGKV